MSDDVRPIKRMKRSGAACRALANNAWPQNYWGASKPPSRIPPEAIAAVERVLAHRAGVVSEVPGKERWRSTTVKHQAGKAESHAMEALCGVEADRDTGEHPLAHAAARALLGLALALQRKDPR